MSETILIDRVAAIQKFLRIFDGTSPKRVLRIEGVGKMGKSRLLREYRKLSKDQNSHCALIDLRSQFQTYSDIVFSITQQMPSLEWDNFIETQNQLRSAAKVEIKGTNLLLSTMSVNLSNEQKESDSNYDRQRITSAFCKDLHTAKLNSPIILLFDTFDGATTQTKTWLNEQFISAVLQVPKVCIVFAGRSLPEIHSNWEDVCDTYVLPPATLEDHMLYCHSLDLKASDEIIEAFHEVFEGIPGLFAEYAAKLKEK